MVCTNILLIIIGSGDVSDVLKFIHIEYTDISLI